MLGRQISVKSWGLLIERHNRLAEGLLEEFETGSRQVETPGVKEEFESIGDFMNPAEAARFRRGAAKFYYMAQDRADPAYGSKEVPRHMAKLEKGDMKNMIACHRLSSLISQVGVSIPVASPQETLLSL